MCLRLSRGWYSGVKAEQVTNYSIDVLCKHGRGVLTARLGSTSSSEGLSLQDGHDASQAVQRSNGVRLRGRHPERLDDAFETFTHTFASLLFVQEIRSIALDERHICLGKRGLTRQDDNSQIDEPLVEPNALEDFEPRPVAIEVDVQNHRIDARARCVQALPRDVRVPGVQDLIAVPNEEL
jgi:hypothetical protein